MPPLDNVTVSAWQTELSRRFDEILAKLTVSLARAGKRAAPIALKRAAAVNVTVSAWQTELSRRFDEILAKLTVSLARAGKRAAPIDVPPLDNVTVSALTSSTNRIVSRRLVLH